MYIYLFYWIIIKSYHEDYKLTRKVSWFSSLQYSVFLSSFPKELCFGIKHYIKDYLMDHNNSSTSKRLYWSDQLRGRQVKVLCVPLRGAIHLPELGATLLAGYTLLAGLGAILLVQKTNPGLI